MMHYRWVAPTRAERTIIWFMCGRKNKILFSTGAQRVLELVRKPYTAVHYGIDWAVPKGVFK